MIRIYTSIIITFYKSVGVPNYISAASLLLSFVILGYLGTLLNLLETNIRKMGGLIVIGIPLALFLLIYFSLSKNKIKQSYLDRYERLNSKEKILYGTLSFLFTILSGICFLKTYHH